MKNWNQAAKLDQFRRFNPPLADELARVLVNERAEARDFPSVIRWCAEFAVRAVARGEHGVAPRLRALQRRCGANTVESVIRDAIEHIDGAALRDYVLSVDSAEALNRVLDAARNRFIRQQRKQAAIDGARSDALDPQTAIDADAAREKLEQLCTSDELARGKVSEIRKTLLRQLLHPYGELLSDAMQGSPDSYPAPSADGRPNVAKQRALDKARPTDSEGMESAREAWLPSEQHREAQRHDTARAAKVTASPDPEITAATDAVTKRAAELGIKCTWRSDERRNVKLSTRARALSRP